MVPWFVDGRYVRSKQHPATLVAVARRRSDSELLAAAPELAAALKLALGRGALDADPVCRDAAVLALSAAGVLWSD